jgi:hypothetical protein
METYYPFAVPPGNTMTENQWSQMFRYVLGTGVISVSFQDQLNQLLVTPGPTALTVNIDTGAAWIQGHYYQSDAVNTLTINQNPSSSVRSDLVVLECKWGLDAGITAKVVEGTPGVLWPATSTYSGPMPPTPIQTYGVKWQLPLAQINTAQNTSVVYVPTDIIDFRAFVAAGTAKSSTFVVASDGASPLIRANADSIIPYGAQNAEDKINEAIQIVSGFGGGTVQLSEGTFNTTGTIEMATNVNLRGLGKKTLIQYHTASGTSNYPIIQCANADNITISDLSIDGGGTTMLEAAPDANITGFEGIYITDGTFNIVKNCWIERCLNNGVLIYSTAGTSTLTDSYGHRVEGCYLGNNRGAGIHLEANGGIFSSNQIDHNLYGIIMQSSSTTGGFGASINVVSNNSIRQNLRDGIIITAIGGAGNNSQNQIFGNIISNSGRNPGAGGVSAWSGIALAGAGTFWNKISGNFIQCWMAPRQLRAIYFDTLANHNDVTNNTVINSTTLTGATDIIGPAPEGTNRIKYNWVTGSSAYD